MSSAIVPTPSSDLFLDANDYETARKIRLANNKAQISALGFSESSGDSSSDGVLQAQKDLNGKVPTSLVVSHPHHLDSDIEDSGRFSILANPGSQVSQ